MNTEPMDRDSAPRDGMHAIRKDLEAVRSTTMDLEQQLLVFVRERPVASVLAALVAGYVTARLFTRR